MILYPLEETVKSVEDAPPPSTPAAATQSDPNMDEQVAADQPADNAGGEVVPQEIPSATGK